MKVLVVEDEQRIAHYLKKGLELKSAVVDVAYDGEMGLDLASTESYDVIILDRLLPGIDGLELCQQLRAQGNHTPILMLTALSTVNDRVTGLNAGADDYLPKPFAFAELLARIEALRRRPVHTQTLYLRVDSLTLDPQTNQVTRAGQPIRLSKKEFALLEFLMHHQGKTLSSHQLVSHVWEFDSDVLPNTAQVYISYLRQKIDAAFPHETPLIHTIRGFGYQFGSL